MFTRTTVQVCSYWMHCVNVWCLARNASGVEEALVIGRYSTEGKDQYNIKLLLRMTC